MSQTDANFKDAIGISNKIKRKRISSKENEIKES